MGGEKSQSKFRGIGEVDRGKEKSKKRLQCRNRIWLADEGKRFREKEGFFLWRKLTRKSR